MLILVVSDQFRVTKLFKVFVVLPVGEVLTLTLVASHLIQDGEVCSAVLRAELVSDLLEKFQLVLGQVRVTKEGTKVIHGAILLDGRLKELVSLSLWCSIAVA